VRLYQAILKLLDKNNGYYESLLRAEIHLENGKLFVSAQQLSELRGKLGKFDWFRKIILIRAQERLFNKFNKITSNVTLAY
jgi:hypothetical protein